MSQNLLLVLNEDQFIEDSGFFRPPAAMRRHLRSLRSVGQLALALRTGAVTERMVRTFAARWIANLVRGTLATHELDLAALAVALETCDADFAEEYLCDLSRLNMAEFRSAIGVARECLKGRWQRPRNEVRLFHYAPPLIRPTPRACRAVAVARPLMIQQTPVRFSRRCDEASHA